MYAVVRTGSKQYRIEPGVEFLVEKLKAEPGDTVKLDDILAFSDGTSVVFGTPTVGALIECLCVGHEKGVKKHTVKYRRRKNYRRTMGHRQEYTRLRVSKLEKQG